MSKPRKHTTLPDYTEITVVARKGSKTVVKNMTYASALALKENKKGWSYLFYQKGFTNIKSN